MGLFGVNGIFLIHDWLGFEPSYYVVEDFLVFEDRWREIRERVRASTCFFPSHFQHADFVRANHRYFRAIYDFDPRGGFPRFSRNAALSCVCVSRTQTTSRMSAV